MSQYLDRFVFPTGEAEQAALYEMYYHELGEVMDSFHPFGFLSAKGLRELSFPKSITVLYGGNGSGKSTVLNIIANKLALARVAPFNMSDGFLRYAELCSFETCRDEDGTPVTVPDGSAIITSDDIFDYMLTVRTGNEQVRDDHAEAKAYHDAVSYNVRTGNGPVPKLAGMEDYDRYRREVMALNRNLTRRKFIRRSAGPSVRLQSNGETALAYFNARIQPERLYCLDEPENSLSAKHQRDLAEIISRTAHYCDCQFIIATHSPFLLSLPGACIYNLDETPVGICDWWECENMRVYADFFLKHRSLFGDKS